MLSTTTGDAHGERYRLQHKLDDWLCIFCLPIPPCNVHCLSHSELVLRSLSQFITTGSLATTRS